MDERLAMVAARVPEFGGLYFDADRHTMTAHVLQLRPQLQRDLRQALSAAFPGEGLPDRLRLVRSDHNFSDLARWRDEARALFTTMPEVTAVDIDDRSNQLVIGMSTMERMPELAAHLSSMGVPPTAWSAAAMDGVTMQSSVTDRHRPVMGGLQIQIGSALGGTCTYGLTATRNGVDGFITNSHCTRVQGGVESTRYAQPSFASDDRNTIATEVADPAYFTGGSCPATFRCRYSDSAFAQRSTTASRAIARNSIGSLAWDGDARYYVVNERTPFVGLALRKLGRTTGHTTGIVESTCIDLRQTGTNIVMLCQADASYESDSGDSGSPVFRTSGCTVNGESDVCADVYGLHWGSGGAFSPIANIQRSSELGPIETCASQDC